MAHVRGSLLLVSALALVACTKDESKRPTPTSPSTQGSRVEAPEYTVELTAKENGGTIVISAKAPLHVNPEYPASFRPEAGAAKFSAEKVPLKAEAKVPCAAKAEDTCETTSSLTYEATVGAQVAGTVQFSVCEPEKCLIEKARVVATVR